MKKLIITIVTGFFISSGLLANNLSKSAFKFMKKSGYIAVKVERITSSNMRIYIPSIDKKIELQKPSSSSFSGHSRYWAKLGAFGKIKEIIDSQGKEFDAFFLDQRELKKAGQNSFLNHSV